jgi:hypothetical protein
MFHFFIKRTIEDEIITRNYYTSQHPLPALDIAILFDQSVNHFPGVHSLILGGPIEIELIFGLFARKSNLRSRKAMWHTLDLQNACK